MTGRYYGLFRRTILALILAFVSTESPLELPYFCDRVNCLPVNDCPSQVIIPGGGIGKCCDVCVSFQGSGKPCKATSLPYDLSGVIGSSTSRHILSEFCEPRLACILPTYPGATYNCQDPNTGGWACYDLKAQYDYLWKLQKMMEAKDEWLEGKAKLWVWEPKCDERGAYKPKQCKGNKADPRCFCVDEQGNTLFGYDFRDENEMSCVCSRAYNRIVLKYGESEALFRCDAAGNFEPMQCIDGRCFCTNATTGEVISTTVPLAIMEELPCYDEKYGSGYYTMCEKEKIRLRKLRAEFVLKGVHISIYQEPHCEPDGSYARVQCVDKSCYCTDRNGQEIEQFAWSSNNVNTYDCKCARDLSDQAVIAGGGSQLQCDAMGEYTQLQCQGNVCYCVDNDGIQVTDSYEKGTSNFCKICNLPCLQYLPLDPITNPCPLTRPC